MLQVGHRIFLTVETTFVWGVSTNSALLKRRLSVHSKCTVSYCYRTIVVVTSSLVSAAAARPYLNQRHTFANPILEQEDETIPSSSFGDRGYFCHHHHHYHHHQHQYSTNKPRLCPRRRLRTRPNVNALTLYSCLAISGSQVVPTLLRNF